MNEKLKPNAKITRNACPGDIIKGRPVWDRVTLRASKNHHIWGCRGISCKKCWEEVFNDKT